MPESIQVHQLAGGVIAAYGLLALIGGTIGYVKAGSVASVVAGSFSGLLLLVCGVGAFSASTWSLGGGMLVALALVGRFAPKLKRRPVSSIGILMVLGGVLVALVAGLALILSGGS